jgi:hypothetical protein
MSGMGVEIERSFVGAPRPPLATLPYIAAKDAKLYRKRDTLNGFHAGLAPYFETWKRSRDPSVKLSGDFAIPAFSNLHGAAVFTGKVL